ncbi:MAG: hypothetical protein JWR40_2407 [Massilia sp.]|jgi:hypothetical protein|nr:hypothetical protein [Massilia sp.]MDB5948543.1 hypothetical protein [Massilia sp.]
MLAQGLIIFSAGIVMLLGLVHLVYTYFGDKLHPRDADLLARLKTTSPVISRQTSVWKAYIGFNASHSLGAILFGALYGFLAIEQPALLFHSWFLGFTGLIALGAWFAMAKLYWFNRPLQGIALACLAYVAGFIFANMRVFA